MIEYQVPNSTDIKIESLKSHCINVLNNYFGKDCAYMTSQIDGAEKGEKYSKPRGCSFHLNREKKKTYPGICMRRVNYKATMFPRYKYHLELIEKQKKEYDICIPAQSTILVCGREADISWNLLDPLEVQQTTTCINDQDWQDVILVVFSNSIDGDCKTFGLDKVMVQKKMPQ